MAVITRSRTVQARRQAVWDLLADFGALSSWVDRVDHSSILTRRNDGRTGTARRVQMGRTTLVETITAFDEPTVLAYDIEGLPPRLGRLNNRWTLQSAGSDTVVAVTSTIDSGSGVVAGATGLLIGRVMSKTADELLDALARRMESRR